MELKELKEEIRRLVEQQEIDEDILVVIESCKTVEEAEQILEEYANG